MGKRNKCKSDKYKNTGNCRFNTLTRPAEQSDNVNADSSTSEWRKKKQRCNKHLKTHANNSSASSDLHETDDNLEIPGFYYDKEKKKYFKILSGQNNATCSSIVTREVICNRTKEEKRKNDIKKFKRNSKRRLKNRDSSDCKNVHFPPKAKTWREIKNIFSIVDYSRYGILSEYHSKCKLSKTVIEHLSPFSSTKIFNSPSVTYDRLEHMLKMYPCQLQQNNVVCLWSLKDLLVQRMQSISIKSVDNLIESKACMDVKLFGSMIPKAYSKITSMCSALIDSKGLGEYVLYTTMCAVGNNPSLAMLRNLNCESIADFRLTEFNLSSKATWCCAWNPVCPQFSVGTEKAGLLIHVETRKLWELRTDNSDVLSQAFKKDGSMLYSGTRKGSICAHDLRSCSTYVVSRLQHKSAVSHLYTSTDNNYLFASDFDSKIKKWDIRQRKVVLEYQGHNNSYSMIPLHVNETLGIIYSAGQDCYTRIWDINNGDMITSIPPPHPAAITNIPSVYYSCAMGQQSNRPGLIMGILDELHFYSF